jgi:hypothetical protein
MKMKFKTRRFDPLSLLGFDEDLSLRGVVGDMLWTRGYYRSDSDKADAWIFAVDGIELLSWREEWITVNAQGETRALLCEALIARGLLTHPTFGVGVACFLAYALLQLVVVAYAGEKGGILLAILLTSYVLLMLGHVIAAQAEKSDPQLIGGIILMVPALALTAPSSLLNLPLISRYRRNFLYRQGMLAAGKAKGSSGDVSIPVDRMTS